ncbi:MAG: MaoC family dehydratase N-terminal domain-containing protein [Pseudonocardiales bacterium]|nr:MaoC family dehydratase N-terminal domain-containing protein [Pseudonocardiales bacterium]MBV9029635.1 MaoC family dehydratase N-terminal domain-containing protein [Pseudonocardiales bacterium]MBW0009682.1 MaoC family dehydratase N-terminal domain-containing protein [Pseudonocardiales bacterium]
MALDPSFLGRCYPATGTYQVGREKIREFAEAIGDDDALYHDPGVARARGYSDVIAPPTFAIILTLRAQRALVCDPQLGLDYSRMVHGNQSFTHHRPIQAGDELAVTLHVDGVRAMGGNDVLTVCCQITDAAGDPVTTARSMLVVRREDR